MVPGSVKWVFDRFPIVQYDLTNKDKFLSSDKLERMHPFSIDADKQSKRGGDNFQLGVYEIFHYVNSSGHKVILASDPLCLYVQLSLCNKNGLKLPIVQTEDNGRTNNETGQIGFTKDKPLSEKDINILAVLSEKAHRDERLPILIETSEKERKQRRYVRSMDSLMAILDSKLDHKESAIGKLLDTTVYDCFLFSVVHDGIVTETFGNSPDILQTLVKRNQFFTRHNTSALGSYLDPLSMDSNREVATLRESTKEILLLVQELYPQFSIPLKFKVTSYVLSLARVPSFEKFMQENKLYEMCEDTLKDFY